MKNDSALVRFDWAVKRLYVINQTLLCWKAFCPLYLGKKYVLSKCWKAKATRIVSMINSTR